MFDYRGTGFSGPSLCEDMLDSLKNFGKTNPSTEAYKAKEIELYMKCRTSLPEKNIDIHSFSSFQMAAGFEPPLTNMSLLITYNLMVFWDLLNEMFE